MWLFIVKGITPDLLDIWEDISSYLINVLLHCLSYRIFFSVNLLA